MEKAFTGRKVSSGSCYNRRRINDLESQAVSDKMDHYIHRHSEGTKVKWFVPVSEQPQNGLPENKRAMKKSI
jgi:hypothetical protein